MNRYTFLIRNKDLYNIGFTDDLKSRVKKLRASEVIAVLEADNSEEVFRRLTRRYSDKQIPETEYYRLSKIEVEDCKRLLVNARAINSLGLLGGANIFAVLVWWLSLSGLICWYIVRPLFGGNAF